MFLKCLKILEILNNNKASMRRMLFVFCFQFNRTLALQTNSSFSSLLWKLSLLVFLGCFLILALIWASCFLILDSYRRNILFILRSNIAF